MDNIASPDRISTWLCLTILHPTIHILEQSRIPMTIEQTREDFSLWFANLTILFKIQNPRLEALLHLAPSHRNSLYY